METLYLSPKELTPYINNPKLHEEEQIEKIIKSIELTGFDQPIVVNKENNKLVIVKGHGRLEASLRLKLDKVPVVVLEVSKEVADKARLIDNKSAEGEYDIEKLLSELGKFREDLEDTGYDELEYTKLLKTLEDELDMDDEPDNGSGNRNREIDVDSYEFDHTCPKCNFQFND